MKKNDLRRRSIEKCLEEKGVLRIRELAEMFDVSEMTIRRDVSEMEKLGKARNLNGIVFSPAEDAPHSFSKQYDVLKEEKNQPEAKSALGEYAASLVERGDSIFMDVGSTVNQIAKCIPRDLKCNVLCTTLNSFLPLADNHYGELSLLGGLYDSGTQMFLSEENLSFIRRIRASKLFLSAAGIHQNLGLSCANSYEVPVKRALIQSAERVILVADSGKFGLVRSAYFCDLADVHEVITDDGLSEQWIDYLTHRGIKVHIVPLNSSRVTAVIQPYLSPEIN